MRNALSWNHCFICSSVLKEKAQFGTRTRPKQTGGESCQKDEATLPHKIIFQYLLKDCQQENKKGSLLLQQIESLNSTTNDSINTIPPTMQFCGFCEKLSEQVQSLHLELEVIQMKLIDKLKTVKQCVISNSRLYGSNNKIRLQFQKFEDWLDQQKSIGVDRESERKFLEALHLFQTSVFESDLQLRNIPLVYLTRYIGGGSCPLSVPFQNHTNIHGDEDAGTGTSDSIVKKELIGDNDYQEDTFEADDFLDTNSYHDEDPQLEFKDECLTVSTTNVPPTAPASKRRNKRRKKRKAIKTKPAFSAQIQKKMKTETGQKVQKSKPSVPLRTSSSRAAASTANKRFKDLRNYKPGYQVITKVEKAVTPKVSKLELSEAQKLAREIRKKRNARKKPLKKNVNRKLKVCEECSYETLTPARMEQHYREHEGTEDERKLECPDCKMKFKRNQYFEFHITHHCGLGRWFCDACSTSIARQKLKEHVNEHHEGKLYSCDNCCSKFSSFPNLISHKRFHLLGTETKHNCLECPEQKSFKSKVRLLRHLHEDHGHKELLLKCTYEDCDATFYMDCNLKTHFNVHERRYVCETCDKAFRSLHQLEFHIRVIHKKEKPFECEHCEEKFTVKSTLESHLLHAHNVATYKCEVCSEAFTTLRLLRAHKALKHGIGEIEYITCKICNKKFTNKGFYRHRQLHVDKKDFTCEVCGFATTTRGLLKCHMAKHTEDKKYACSYCPKTFAVRKYLNDHLRIHTLERPFQCEICGSSFNQKGALNLHKKKHVEGDSFVPKGPRLQKEKASGLADYEGSCVANSISTLNSDAVLNYSNAPANANVNTNSSQTNDDLNPNHQQMPIPMTIPNF